MMRVADAIAGPVAFLFDFRVVLLMLIGAILVEAIVLWLFKLLSFGAALRSSAIANVVSAIVGLALAVGGMTLNIVGSIFSWLVLWALSVVIEGAVLTALTPSISRRVWLPIIVMNAVSYALIAMFVLMIYG